MRDLIPWGNRSSISRSVFDEMDRALNDLFGRDLFPSAITKSTYPKMNVYDDNGDLCIDAFVPEVSKDKLSVKIEEEVLTLSGTSEVDRKVDDSKFYCRELSKRSFSRSIQLPDGLDLDSVKAEHKDGMLKMRIPYVKKEEPKTARTISIA
jgi:HSP20 family protein